MRKFVSIIVLLIVVVCITSFKKPLDPAGIYIIIEKTQFEMRLYDASGEWLSTYPVVFGNDDLKDKMTEGDRRTPEGVYHVVLKKPHPKWVYYLGLDYPTAEDVAKFNDRKAKGIIPANSRIGGEIGIHGTWPNQDFVIDHFQNWTNGCICTKNEYMQELYKTIPVGTKVIIKR